MALYFNERGLRYDDGKIFLISYQKLLEECLKHPYNTVSISAIIFSTVNSMTGKKIIKGKYNQSKLYQWLEQQIRQDPRYIQAKQVKYEQDSMKRQYKKEYEKKMKQVKGINKQLEYIEKKRARYKLSSSKEW